VEVSGFLTAFCPLVLCSNTNILSVLAFTFKIVNCNVAFKPPISVCNVDIAPPAATIKAELLLIP